MEMETKRYDGGQAYPMGYHRDGNSADHGGMSLRDWFAGQALAGLIACATSSGDPEKSADYCYQVADAMLKARAE